MTSSMKVVVGLIVGAMLSTAVATAMTDTDREAVQTALSHVQEAEAILEDILAQPTDTVTPVPTVVTSPPTTTDPPVSGVYTPLPLTLADFPSDEGYHVVPFHPDASGVQIRYLTGDGKSPAFALRLPVAGSGFVDPLLESYNPDGHEHTFLGVVPTYNTPVAYWNQPGWDEAAPVPYIQDDNGQLVAETPGVWMPTMFVNNQRVRLNSVIPVYYECHRTTVAPGRRAYALPNGAGFVTEQHLIKVVGDAWRITFFGPIGFHESISTNRLESATANRDQLWFQSDGPLPPESEGWYATPQVEVYWQTRVPSDVDFPRLVRFGSPTNTTVTAHMDYVSAGTPLGNSTVTQILIDWACNQPEPSPYFVDGRLRVLAVQFRNQ